MPELGHNSGETVGGIAAEALRQYISRLERLQNEIDALNADKSEVFKEAKARGYEVSAIRAVVQKRRKAAKDPNKFAELSEIIELYEGIVGISDAPSRAHVNEGDE